MFYGMQINLLFYATDWLRTKNMAVFLSAGYLSDMFVIDTKQNDTCELVSDW
jgi:hypothetical protein